MRSGARPLVPLALVVVLCGCGGGDRDETATMPSSAVAAPAEPSDDPCAPARPERKVAKPRGLVVPKGIEVGEVADAPPNQRAAGFVPMTPQEFLEWARGRDDLGLLFQEFEGGDAEVMVSDGKVRSFWKLVQSCPEGSSFAVLTGRELAPGAARDAIRAKRKSR